VDFIYRDRMLEFSARPGDTDVMVADKLDGAINFYPAAQPIQTREDLERFARAWLSQVEPRIVTGEDER
jgi:hypothetical protein